MGFDVIILALTGLIDPIVWGISMKGLGLKHKVHKSFYFFAMAGYCLITFLKQFIQYLNGSPIIYKCLNYCVPLYIIAVSLALFSGSLYRKFIQIGLYYCILFASDIICFGVALIIFQQPVSTIFATGIVNVLCSIGSRIIVCLLCWLFFYRGEKTLSNKLYANSEIVHLIIIDFCFEIPAGMFIKNERLYNDVNAP